jgi:uncharacterized membrane protein YebE (DUF533 family)
MGFLDRLVADVIARETGLPVRGLVRKAGVGKLVAAGGVLAAGAAAVSWMQQQQQQRAGTSPQPGGTPLPLPPIPGRAAAPALGSHGPNLAATPPPPLPPLPTMAPPPPPPPMATTTPAAEVDDGLDPHQRFVLARVVIAAAMADGVLAPAERETVERHLGEADDLSAEQQQRLRRDLVLPATAEELAALAPDPELRATMYRTAALIVAADGQRDHLESAWLGRLAGALGIDAEQQRAVESQVLSMTAGA